MAQTIEYTLDPFEHTPLKIFPITTNKKIPASLEKHTEEMAHVVAKLLGVDSTLSNVTLVTRLKKQLPIVHWENDDISPEGISLYLLCEALPNYDLFQFFCDMVVRWLIPGTQATILHAKHLTFRFIDHPKNSYFVAEIFVLVEESQLTAIKNTISSFLQEIALGAVSAPHAKHILVSKAVTQEQKTTVIHKTIIDLAHRKIKAIGPDIFVEMHHFLLACDDEFKRIRAARHMSRIICYHNWFRKRLKELTTQRRSERHILIKAMETNLQFHFGEKRVVALVIAVNELKEYEQFEARHILSAVRRFIPTASCVPHSFFSYGNSSDTIQSFYVEIEKQDSYFTQKEIQALKQGLTYELPLSIEHLSHKLFMPQNEEEILRNILLLSQEIRYVQDLPQMIISFHGQSDAALTFHIILIRVIKNEHTPTMESLFEPVQESVRFVSGTKKIVGQLRTKYPKEANIFFVECPKREFIRQDHSIDLARAREFVVVTLKNILGEVRDFNGGLILQQNKLLTDVKNLLGPYEKKHEIYLENLFYAIQPILMRSILHEEHLKHFFELFLALKKEKAYEKQSPRYKEFFKDNLLCLIACTKESSIVKVTSKMHQEVGLTEGEVATTSIVINGITFFGYIVVAHDEKKMMQFKELFEETLSLWGTTLSHPKSLRISLPRPLLLLDPRLGADRTSGVVIKMLYEGLMRMDPCGRPTPGACSRVCISEDQKTYTFTLRESHWTNGLPVTAYDFEYAWKKVLDPNFTTLFAYLFYPIKNARLVKAGQKPLDEVGIIAKDYKTLEVQLEHPAPYFLELTSHGIYSPLCKEVDMAHPGWAYYGSETHVCNGPFRLARWKRASEIQALKNVHYWDAASVKLQQVDISIIENPEQALELYQKGDLDWIGEPLSEIPPHVFQQKKFNGKMYSHPITAIHWYVCNVQRPPFSSQKCRQALAIALNRQQLINEVLEGSEQPAYSILPPGLSLMKGAYFHDGDHEAARALFEEGLREQNMSIKELPPFVITCLDQELYKSCALASAKQWQEALGIDVQIVSYKWEEFLEHYSNQDFHIVSITWYSWFNDPIYNLNTIKSRSYEMSTAKWENPEYVEILDLAQECVDPHMRSELLRKAESIAMKEMPVIPVFYYALKYMKKEYVHNIFLSNFGQIDFKWATIENGEKR